jgi:hypothetical protein
MDSRTRRFANAGRAGTTGTSRSYWRTMRRRSRPPILKSVTITGGPRSAEAPRLRGASGRLYCNRANPGGRPSVGGCPALLRLPTIAAPPDGRRCAVESLLACQAPSEGACERPLRTRFRRADATVRAGLDGEHWDRGCTPERRAPNHSQRSTNRGLELHFWIGDGTGPEPRRSDADRDVLRGVVFFAPAQPKRDPQRWVAYSPMPASVLSLYGVGCLTHLRNSSNNAGIR